MFGKKPDQRRLQAILDEAGVIAQSGFYAEAKQIEGMVAGIRKDQETVRQKFSAALKCSGGEQLFKLNYAHAMANAGSFIEAVRLIDEAIESVPDDPAQLMRALELHADSFNLDGCKRILDQLTRLGVVDRVKPDLLDKIEDIEIALSPYDIHWEQIAERLEFVYRLIVQAGTHPLYIAESFSSDSVHVEFGLAADINAAIRVENLIHEKVAALPFSEVDRILSFGCFPE